MREDTHDQYLRLQTCPCISSSSLHTLRVEAGRSQQQDLGVEARGKISKVRAKVSWQHCMHYHTKTESMVRTHHYLDWDLATQSNRWSGGNKDHLRLLGYTVVICQQEEQDRADEKTLTQDVIVARQLDFSRTACRRCTCDPHAYPCIHTVAGVIPDRRRRTAWPVVTVLQIGATRQQAADVLTAIKTTLSWEKPPTAIWCSQSSLCW